MPTDASGHHRIRHRRLRRRTPRRAFLPSRSPALWELDEAAVPESALRHGDLQVLRFRQRGVLVDPLIGLQRAAYP
jgi:hypothetical protein